MPDYSLDRLQARAADALYANRDYAAGLEAAYARAARDRRRSGIPALAIVGMGRAGKDTAGEYLSQTFGLRPVKSSSLNALPLVAHMAGADDLDAFYAERHANRGFWIEACNALRADDLTRLARWCLGACDVAVGLRGKHEFAAVMADGVCDLSVWVDRDVPVDPTVEFAREDCDVVVENRQSLDRFRQRLARLGKLVYRF